LVPVDCPVRSGDTGSDRHRLPTSRWVTNIRTFVDPQNPAQVAVLVDIADMDAVMAWMQTESAAEAMEYDGVLPETLVFLVEA
jgi:hypothetical protein